MANQLSLAQQARLLNWAISRGLLTDEEVGMSLDSDAATLSEIDLSARFEALFLTGRLKAYLDQGLRESAGSEPSGSTSVSRGSFSSSSGSERLRALIEGPAMDPEDLAAFPLPADGNYVPVAFLGDGGMGRVYKAFDQQLKRVVALKFLKRLEPGPVERFLQEGRAQAQIDHPNVCSVFSVDEHQGQPYLAMRFIDGPTLKDALHLLSLEQKARIIKEVALALHSCHRQGIVHRDIKPTNIMLERREDGAWWPYLMDFGLARDLDDTGMTLPGIILGTPVYCSPEQVQGRMGDVDRRSDVYSLGATLYECLSGAPPFPSQGSLMDLVHRISREDPVPLGQKVPNLPRDLQTIVMKTLEKEPAQRYDSARALAEDLERFLDGDPILAHSTSLGYRLLKRFRKNRSLALMAGVSLVLVLGFAGFGLTMAVRGRIQSQSSRTFGREAERMEAILLKAYSLPLHDVRPERQLVQERLEQIQASLPTLGRWSQPAARLALGRGFLALDRLDEARRELEEATGGVPRDPDTALALGLTLSRLYQAELEGLKGKPLADKKKECESSLRQPALACLRRAQGAQQEGPAFVEGVLAMVEERYEHAILKAKEYQHQAPWAYEAWILEADAQRVLAAQAFDKGDFPLTERRLALAGDALVQAQTVARSAPAAYLSEIQRRMVGYQLRLDRGQANEADRDWALEATERCLKANPEDWKALGYRAAILRRWGAALIGRDQDPGATLDAAIASAEAGLKVRPTDNALWNNLGSVLRSRAEWEFKRGADPTRTLARAVEALQKALARPQFKDWLLNSIGCCHALLAGYQLDHGENPAQAVADAETCLNQAAAIKPWVGHSSTLGLAYLDLATYQHYQNQDPQPTLAKARQAMVTAVQLNANSFQAQMSMSQMQLLCAEINLERGGPIGADARDGREHLGEALKLNPGLAVWVHAGQAKGFALEALAEPPGSPARTRALQAARAAVAKAQTGRGKDPREALAIAEAWLFIHKADGGGAAATGLAALRPALSELAWNANVYYLQSRLLGAQGQRDASEQAFRKATERNPNLLRAARR
jgi:serine/threonine-protein kinase